MLNYFICSHFFFLKDIGWPQCLLLLWTPRAIRVSLEYIELHSNYCTEPLYLSSSLIPYFLATVGRVTSHVFVRGSVLGLYELFRRHMSVCEEPLMRLQGRRQAVLQWRRLGVSNPSPEVWTGGPAVAPVGSLWSLSRGVGRRGFYPVASEVSSGLSFIQAGN